MIFILIPMIAAALAMYLDMKADMLGVSARQRRILKAAATWAFVPALPIAWPVFKVIAWRRRRRAAAQAAHIDEARFQAAHSCHTDIVAR